MCKRTLRSVLAVAFSAGLVLGAASTLDLGWDGATAVVSVSDVSQDLGWDSGKLDLGWDSSGTVVSAADVPDDLGWDGATAVVAVPDGSLDLGWDSVQAGAAA
jgi:hypothetical protein